MKLDKWEITMALTRFARTDQRGNYAALMLASLAAKRDRRPLEIHGELEQAIQSALAEKKAAKP